MNEEEERSTINKAGKTRSITFRLESSIIEELQIEAEYRETSLNVLINQILRRYSNWERYEGKMGMLPIPKIILASLMDEIMRIGKENGIEDISSFRNALIKELSQIAFTFLKDSVLLIKKNYNLVTVLEVLEQYMKVVGINSDHRIEDDGKHIYVIQHKLGENWALFIKEFLILLFENLGKVKADISNTQNTTVAKVFINL
jgi:predicted HicB family RNase H-like nuclease